MNRPISFVPAITVAMIMLGVVPAAQAYKKVNAVLPQAPRQVLEGVKQIAVLDFSGERGVGRKLADLMVELLVKEDRVANHYADAPGKIFKVIERSRLQQVLSEQKLREAGVIDDAQAAQVGKVLGIDVIITGSVTHSLAQRDEWEEHTTYVKKQAIKQNVLCTTREVAVDCNIRIIDVNNGEIRLSESTRPVASDNWCRDEEGGLLTEEALVNQVLERLAPSLVAMFEPYGRSVDIELHKVKTPDKADSKLAEEAAEAADAGNLNRAYAIYSSLYQKDNFNVQLLYNLGVLYEVTGSLLKAREMYETARTLKDEDKFRDGLERVAGAEMAWNYYSKMGVTLVAANFDTLAAAQEAAKAATPMATTKGKEKDRINVYTTSDMTAVLTALPGKVQVPMLEHGARWVKVKLPGGKEGYVSVADIK
jgi:curli biogenesis system outer membrane secretion channel CsgG